MSKRVTTDIVEWTQVSDRVNTNVVNVVSMFKVNTNLSACSFYTILSN